VVGLFPLILVTKGPQQGKLFVTTFLKTFFGLLLVVTVLVLLMMHGCAVT
jgi:hypothetical protein